MSADTEQFPLTAGYIEKRLVALRAHSDQCKWDPDADLDADGEENPESLALCKFDQDELDWISQNAPKLHGAIEAIEEQYAVVHDAKTDLEETHDDAEAYLALSCMQGLVDVEESDDDDGPEDIDPDVHDDDPDDDVEADEE